MKSVQQQQIYLQQKHINIPDMDINYTAATVLLTSTEAARRCQRKDHT